MNREEAYIILDALAEGCSPFTGELLSDHPILNDRKVIRALQIALDGLEIAQPAAPPTKLAAPLEQKTILAVIAHLREANTNPTVSKLTKFFLGSRHFKNSILIKNEFYGALKHHYNYTSLKPIIMQLVQDNIDLKAALKPFLEEKPWDDISYFQKEKFCRLSAKAVEQLKEKISELGIVKQPAILSDYILQARIVFPRAYEPWTEKELEYLSKAMTYTNDLQLLSNCFQRGERSIESVGKKLIYEGKSNSPDV